MAIPPNELTRDLILACKKYSNRLAIEGEGVAFSYGNLLDEAETLGLRLIDAGIGKASAVMVKCSNHPSDFVALLGVWRAGAAVVPVHRTSPEDVVSGIQAKARCLASIDLLAGPWPACFSAMVLGETTSDGREKLLRDAALVIFTSGSTGLPKGAVLSHHAFRGKLHQNTRLFQPTVDTVTLLVLNNTFSFGIWVALMTLLNGGRVVTMSRFSPLGFLETLVEKGVTFVGVVPTMIRATFGTLSASELDASRLRLKSAGKLEQVVIGGEPLGKQLSGSVRAFIEPALLFDVYGLTETSTSDFYLDPKDYPEYEASIGRPAPGISYRVVDAQGNACGTQSVGELQLKTPFIMEGYLGDQDITTSAFAEGWFRTGDLATFDDAGYVTIVGRLKELIVRGGNKITPLEIERALMRCSGVGVAMVTGLADPILGQRIHAFVVPRVGEIFDLQLIKRELAGLLEKFKCPDFYYVGETLPTGRTGKIDRGQLGRWIESGNVRPIEN
jgi:long-chain acyl-CoA synthetase